MPAIYGLRGLLEGAVADLRQGKRVQIAGASEGLAQLAALALVHGGAALVDSTVARRPKLVVVLPTAKELASWAHALANAPVNPQVPIRVALLPSQTNFGNDRFINPAAVRRQRLYALSRLAGSAGALILTTVPGLAQATLPPETFRAASVVVVAGRAQDLDQFLSQLDDLGYVPTLATVQEEGTYAVRGGIVDVYPPSCDHPLRCEFLGEELVSIRTFNPDDQKSLAALTEATICPAYEALTPKSSRRADAQRLHSVLLDLGAPSADREGMVSQFLEGVHFAGFDLMAPLFRPSGASALAYLGQGDVLMFPAGMEPCLKSYRDWHGSNSAAQAQDLAMKRPVLAMESYALLPTDLAQALAGERALIEFGNPHAAATSHLYRMTGRLSYPGAPMAESHGATMFDKWAEIVAKVVDEGGRVVVVAVHEEQRQRVEHLFAHRGITARLNEGALLAVGFGTLPPATVSIGIGDLPSQLYFEDENLLILPEAVLFGRGPERVRSPKSDARKLQNYLSSFADLRVSDLVVHVQHGIGRYRGLTTLEVAGIKGDFLIVEYAGGDKIYLPVDRLSLLQRYAGGESATAALDRLGGQGWDKRRERVKAALADMAEELLRLSAARAVAKGLGYGPPDDTYLTFEAEFPYAETEDQARAIHDVEADVRSGRPMDRLVCGDVGFGKTEVALRAAMRTVLEGHQVLVLVPTTILCYQHYQTFVRRLGSHGVRVARLDRFCSTSEVRAALDGLATGAVDVLIGTHRLLSQDVKPRRLGLLVVDEEQRFGVSHKEKLKHLKAGAHILTLTATPIPRTLHMAMVGLRDISIIATPPQDRLAVRTYIARYEEGLIREALRQEIARGGQVFFVHNRVEDIEETKQFLTALLPATSIRVAHGQMREHQLERVIIDFLEQKFQVLLCTTIIESGVDMPNVNTLIVDRADRFGLAQLYQLRGRVGRASLQAFAYFLTPALDKLSEEALKRLDVLAAHQELGAGFQIASHDLEIRGAGNLLGADQSGHAAAVGLELYTEMLETQVATIRGTQVEEAIDPEIRLPVSGLIPPGFIASESQRLHLYKRLFAAEDDSEVAALRQEARDRYGAAPPELELLFKVAALKLRLRRLAAARLMVAVGVVEIKFARVLADARIDRLLAAVKRRPDCYRLGPDGRLLLTVAVPNRPSIQEQFALLENLTGLLEPLLD